MSATRPLTLAALVLAGATMAAAGPGRHAWSAADLDGLRSLSLSELEPPPPDPTNRVADDPRAARLGERLFFDTRLSSNRKVACGTCHQPDRDFQDGTPLGHGVGTTGRRTMPIASTSRSPFLFWDGRKDSLWAQALGPLESAVEHGGTRAQYVHVIADAYAAEYESLFGPLPALSGIPGAAGPGGNQAEVAAWLALTDSQREDVTAAFVNIGKAIAAFERRIEVGRARFDRYVDAIVGQRPADGILSRSEVAGLTLFIGKARCTQCHNGPLLSNNEFHNTGVARRAELPLDDGRLAGADAVLTDEFNCRSRWSDARQSCAELDYLVTGDRVLQRAFKVPSLRNVAERGPYMHAGQFATLGEVLDHYNRAPKAPAGHTELTPLGLSAKELTQLESFLRALSGPITIPGAPPGTAAP
jgi:cytochrome c peroxidase